MKGVQLTPNLRVLTMNDNEGFIALVMHHEGEDLINVYEVQSREELSALIQDSI